MLALRLLMFLSVAFVSLDFPLPFPFKVNFILLCLISSYFVGTSLYDAGLLMFSHLRHLSKILFGLTFSLEVSEQ